MDYTDQLLDIVTKVFVIIAAVGSALKWMFLPMIEKMLNRAFEKRFNMLWEEIDDLCESVEALEEGQVEIFTLLDAHLGLERRRENVPVVFDRRKRDKRREKRQARRNQRRATNTTRSENS